MITYLHEPESAKETPTEEGLRQVRGEQEEAYPPQRRLRIKEEDWLQRFGQEEETPPP